MSELWLQGQIGRLWSGNMVRAHACTIWGGSFPTFGGIESATAFGFNLHFR